MKRSMFAALVLILAVSWSSAQHFDRYFINKTMRVDYYHTGTKGEETISLDRVYEENLWSGTRNNLSDPLNLGEYMVKVFDFRTNTLIFSQGYSSLFLEWQTTDEALAGIHRTFHESVRVPFPKNSVQLTIARRDKKMVFHEVFTTVIDPNSPTQVNRQKKHSPYRSVKLMDHGTPESKVDLLIIGDGYAKADLEKFRKDANHFSDVLFTTSPFKERQTDFNVWTIEVLANESGIDIPDKNIWKDNPLGTQYNTFGSARYILTEENRTLRDIASAVPYDAIAILCNDNRYGGGGIYNLYITCYTQTDVKGMEWQMDYVFVHELGHSFGGLGDEYYTSSVAYNDFYAKGVEPWEPNITALLDPQNLKWKSLVPKDTPLPTPWVKAEFESVQKEQMKLDRLAPDYYTKREKYYTRSRELLSADPHAGTVGAFEGAGYSAQGLYRPMIDCRMFSLSLEDFCTVCRSGIDRVIDYYTK